MAVNYKQLKEAYTASPTDAAHGLQESLAEGSTKPCDIELGRLWEELYGHHAYRDVKYGDGLATVVMEAGDAVMSGTFANITGQIVYSAVMEGYNSEPTVFSNLVRTVQSNKKTEVIPGIGATGDKGTVVPEGSEYPLVGLVEDWITTPEPKKRGMILPITKEAIFFDSTGMLLTTAGKIGEGQAANKERRVIDAIQGTVYGSAADNDHKFTRKGTSYLNYYASGGHGVDNLDSAASVLADWTDIDRAWGYFGAMTDFNTGEPIEIVPKHLLVGYANLGTANQIVQAMSAPPQGAVGAAAQGVASPSHLQALGLQVVSSANFTARLAAAEDWFLGDIGKFVWYMQNWPVTVSKAPSNSHDEFHRDIVQQFKVSEKGAAVVVDPHYMVVGDNA